MKVSGRLVSEAIRVRFIRGHMRHVRRITECLLKGGPWIE